MALANICPECKVSGIVKIKHTHRTSFVRSDYELAALCAVLTFNHARDITPGDIEDFEVKYRGIPEFEKALRALADWMRRAAPAMEFEKHACDGQLCDQDGLYDVSLVVRKPGEAHK